MNNFFDKTSQFKKLILIGPCPLPSFTRKQLEEFKNIPLVFIDGGKNHIKNLQLEGSKNSFSVGDGDSYSGPLSKVIPKEKDFSDLAYCLSHIPKNILEIDLYGFLGGRKDHEIANLGEIHKFIKRKKKPILAKFDDKIIILSPGRWNLCHKGIFSLFCLEPSFIELSGNIKYSLKKSTQLSPLSSQGLSNKASGNFQLYNQESSTLLYANNIQIK